MLFTCSCSVHVVLSLLITSTPSSQIYTLSLHDALPIFDPAWAEETGSHVVRRSHSAPHWSSKRAAAMAHEKVTLYGVPIVADRVVGYGRIDREAARDIFIQHALIEEIGRAHV